MRLNYVIALLLVSQVFTLRNLDDATADPCNASKPEAESVLKSTQYKCDLALNSEVVITAGKIAFKDKYLCISGGTPATNAKLSEVYVDADGDYCFPHIYITGLYNRFSNYNKMFYFRILASNNSNFTNNLKVRFYFSTNTVPELDDLFKELTQNISYTKCLNKQLLNKVFESGKTYNLSSAKLATGKKTPSEIKEEITKIEALIAKLKKDLDSESKNHANLESSCSTLSAELEIIEADLQAKNDEAENLDNSINNYKESIKNLNAAIVDNSAGIKLEEDRIKQAQENYNNAMTQLKALMPTEADDLSEIDKKVEALDIGAVNKIVSSFVNIL